MNGPRGYYAYWNNSDKYCMFLLLFRLWKIRQMSKHNKTATDSQIQTSGHQRRFGWREEQNRWRGWRSTEHQAENTLNGRHTQHRDTGNIHTGSVQHVKSLQLCPALWDPLDCSPSAPSPWDSPGKNTWVGHCFLLQGIESVALMSPPSTTWEANFI